jgi:O-antigen/teichoic acid export membrane protein
MKESRKSVVRGLFKGGSIVFVGLALELGISFFGKILMARVLGQVDYGVATLGIKALSFASAILLIGLNTGVGRYLPRFDHEADRKGVILSGLELTLPVAATTAVVLWLFADPVATTLLRAPDAVPVLRAAAVGIPFAVLLKFSVGVVQGMEQTVPKVLIRNIFQPTVRFVLIATVLLFGLGSLGIVWAYTATFVAAGVAGLYYVVRHTPVAVSTSGTRIHREILRFSAPLMLMTSIMMILSNLDVFFLSYFHSAEDIGVYNVVYPLAELLTMTLSGFSFIFLPAFSRLHSEGQEGEMLRIYQVVTKWVLLLTLPALFYFVLFPETIIGMTFGREYTEGALALSILAVGFSVQSLVGPNMQSLTSVGETRTIMWINLAAGATNVVLNYLLIPQYTYLGAAVATSISYTLLNVLYSVALYLRTGIHPFSSHLLKPLAGSIVLMAAVAGIVFTWFQQDVATLFGSFVAFAILYALVILRLDAVQEEEMMLLLSIEERFGVDLSIIKQFAKRVMRDR